MKDMQDFLDLLKNPDYRSRYLIAKRTGACLACGSKVLSLRDASARLEYEVSALCQECQDRYLGAGTRASSLKDGEVELPEGKIRHLRGHNKGKD